MDYVRRFLQDKPPMEEAEAAWQQLISPYRATNNIVGCCSAFLRAAEISKPSLYLISNMANSLNKEHEVIEKMDVAERAALFKPLARLMELSLSSASATDLSRLSWLHLHAGDERRALDIAELGLQRDPDNRTVRTFVDKLSWNSGQPSVPDQAMFRRATNSPATARTHGIGSRLYYASPRLPGHSAGEQRESDQRPKTE